ncbi:unnamed protein product [Urochloa decumbens]|uniref:Uncharacterized protein n=1 Tax=Urochloa decumbens TaxID=240449 RepID=A0ABC8VTM3_9POAL
MASSNKTVTALFVLLLLASSPTMLQARMVPSDHARADQAHIVKESLPSPVRSIVTTVPSQDLARDMAPPSIPPTPSGKPEETAVAKRWGTAQVTADGSVPSPGVGH